MLFTARTKEKNGKNKTVKEKILRLIIIIAIKQEKGMEDNTKNNKESCILKK